MNVLIFAYLEEAQTFINKLNLEKQDNVLKLQIFSKGSTTVLVTGEGIHYTILKLTAFFSQGKDINQILNFGIAGKLDPQLEIEKIYTVNEVCQPGFKYFELDNSADGVSCVSSNYVVDDETTAKSIKSLGQIIDMELWGIAMVCDYFNKSLKAVKIISDDASEKIKLHQIKRRSKFYSNALYKFYLNHYSDSPLYPSLD